MNVAVYICTCGDTLVDMFSIRQIIKGIQRIPGVISVRSLPGLCTEDGRTWMVGDLRRRKPDRVVFAACSPRNQEESLRRILREADMNPYLMQIANIREQAAWVTPKRTSATQKAIQIIRAAIARVQYQQELPKRTISICPDVMVVGAGPAGLSAAYLLAQAGRKVIMVEKSPSLGGMPMLFEEVFPDGTCGSCFMYPLIDGLMHAGHPGQVELLTLSQVAAVRGSFGQYEISIQQNPRFVDAAQCVGCGECVHVCPASSENRKAIDFFMSDAMPHVPYIDASVCHQMHGVQCMRCRDACPVEGAIMLDDQVRLHTRTVGAVVLAIGASLLDGFTVLSCKRDTGAEILSSLDFERMIRSDGPTEGNICTASGRIPARIVFIHCVGSLDKNYQSYCSTVCCRYALKYRKIARQKIPNVEIIHLVREWCLPDKTTGSVFSASINNHESRTMRYQSLASMQVSGSAKATYVTFLDVSGIKRKIETDMVVLCPALIPHEQAAGLAKAFRLVPDAFGFFPDTSASIYENHCGVVTVGSCRFPVDIPTAMDQGRASAGLILASLPTNAVREAFLPAVRVNGDRCSGCRICIGLCAARALDADEETGKIKVHEFLCSGCGICIAACPAKALDGTEYPTSALSAELRGVLEDNEK
jgi:heterodisulfide reductase subunit A